MQKIKKDNMNKFKAYLKSIGISLKVAIHFGSVANKYTEWLKANNLKAGQIKRSQLTDYLQTFRNSGNHEDTIIKKERIIKRYHEFLGTKTNPAKSWIQRKRQHTLPSKALATDELTRIYATLKPSSPAGYRNRCMLGLVVFQGLLRSELQELRISDIDFETGNIFVQGQKRTNSRTLKLEAIQMMHLYDYIQKYRKEFLSYRKTQPDNLFLSKGTGESLNNALSKLLRQLKSDNPQVEDLKHIRGSVITNWEKQHGIIEAMTMAGHRYITSTARYQTNKYDELQDLLKIKHPLEHLNITHS